MFPLSKPSYNKLPEGNIPSSIWPNLGYAKGMWFNPIFNGFRDLYNTQDLEADEERTFGNRGILSNVVFDSFQDKRKNANTIMGTEGTRPYAGGGGSGWSIVRGHKNNSFYAEQPLSGGGTLTIRGAPNSRGRIDADVSFQGRKEFDRENMGMRAAIDRFSEITRHLQDFNSRVKPSSLNFSPADTGLFKFYRTAMPRLHKALGASASRTPAKFGRDFKMIFD